MSFNAGNRPRCSGAGGGGAAIDEGAAVALAMTILSPNSKIVNISN